MKQSPFSFADLLNRRGSASTLLAATVMLATALSGCSDGQAKHANNTQITSAQWVTSANSAQLVASGKGPANEEIAIRNPDTSGLLGRVKASASGSWTLTAALPSPPCTVIADTTRTNATAPIKVVGASAEACAQTAPSKSRTVKQIRANAVVAPNPPAPNGVIVSPTAALNGLPIQISVNDSLIFTAIGSDPSALTPLTYAWDFNGAVPNMAVQNPGSVKFNRPGVFNIRLTVINSQGIPDVTPSMRVVSVSATGSQTTQGALTAAIISPIGDTSIPVGGVVDFGAVAAGGTAPYVFMWDFSGAVPSSIGQTPGAVTFTRAGTYAVTVTVEDTSLPPVRFATPLQVNITVANSPSGANQPPSGIVRSPTTDVTIMSGQTVFFQATAIDPDAVPNTTITYVWDFGRGAPVSALQNPGLITFTNTTASPVTYTVKMTATDAQGAVDPNPPVRNVTVQGATTPSAQAPVADIIEPVADVSVPINTVVTFKATATIDTPNALDTLWTFADVAPDAAGLTPPPVKFTTVGEYSIVFTATDTVTAQSLQVFRVITVTDPAAVPPAASPAPAGFEAEINPRGQVAIHTGESIAFLGGVELPGRAVPVDTDYTYAWTFPGGDPANSTEQNPGPVTYLEVGRFDATLVATSIATGASSEPETKRVIVTDVANPVGGGASPDSLGSPTASIDQPAGDVTIILGDPVEFIGSGTDPNGLDLIYAWDFGLDMPSSAAQNPGNVTFDKVGVFNVRLVVTNSAGQKDRARVKVTVEPPPAAPAAASIRSGSFGFGRR